MLGRIEYLRMPDDDLISKPVTPSATAGSTVFALQITTGELRNSLLDRFVRSPHRHHRSLSIQALLVLLAGKIR